MPHKMTDWQVCPFVFDMAVRVGYGTFSACRFKTELQHPVARATGCCNSVLNLQTYGRIHPFDPVENQPKAEGKVELFHPEGRIL